MKTRHLAASIEGVVQLIAASFLRHGYFWYITGVIPEQKQTPMVDAKLIAKYQITNSEWERTRRRKAGLANVRYIRCERWFILLVTEGHHQIKQPTNQGGEGEWLKDLRRHPVRIGGYSISCRRDGQTKPVTANSPATSRYRAHVRIDSRTYNALKIDFASKAVHRTAEKLTEEFRALPFARYAPVRRQLLNLARLVNDRRKPHNYAMVPYTKIGLRRTIVKAYAEEPET